MQRGAAFGGRIAVRISGARKVFERWGRRSTALDGVDLIVEGGTVSVIFGSNGSGKTTLLRAIRGAVKLDEGEIVLGGRSIDDMRPGDLARFFGYVHQSPRESLCESFTVGEMERLYLGRKNRTDREFEEWRSSNGVSRNTRVRELSGGQQQLLALELALGRRPEVLLLDEPTASLDSRHCEEVLQRIQRTSGSGVTVVFVSHNLRHGIDIADAAIVLHRGRVVRAWSGTEVRKLNPEEVSSTLVEAYRRDMVPRSVVGLGKGEGQM